MGKGFNNYMTKKFFHPASKENIKRVWMAEQKTQFDKKKQEDLLAQYQKEQDMYRNRALLGDEKAKLGLSFMYDAPPGMKKKEQEDGEAEVKFDWQRKYNAPREQYAKDDEMIRDQPFGVEVRNVRCIKCRKWGHVNTDKICPLFGKDLTAEPEQPENSASSLIESMQEDGFALKQSILGRMSDPRASNEQIIDSEDEDDPEVQFLKSLTPKQKKKLLKRLNKLQDKSSGKRKGDKKTKKKKKKRKRSSSSDSDDDPVRKRPKEDSKRKHKQRMDSDSDSSPYRGKHAEKKHLGMHMRQNSFEDRHGMMGGNRQKIHHRSRSSSVEEKRKERKGFPGQSKNHRKHRNSSSSEDEKKFIRMEPRSQRDRHDSSDKEVSKSSRGSNRDKTKQSADVRERDSRQNGYQFQEKRDSSSRRDRHSPVIRGRKASLSPHRHRSRSYERGRRSRSGDRGQRSREGRKIENNRHKDRHSVRRRERSDSH
ncbi:corepressor interacting with RBPJ 1-like isoform X2 [Ylistrum balloti]|uniref:corepressor interacting with RBPJ 1-like isoform X2 n=1 Tax=Ylistrum balloti TaxID=509963 RepID=UPI002905E499|nr:corepressor interacting with RBPJ 1-like isoform X2 [Ylistrum balloti]